MIIELWKDMEWFCDKCDDQLDYQKGFTGKKGFFRCKKCGHINYIKPVVIERKLVKKKK